MARFAMLVTSEGRRPSPPAEGCAGCASARREARVVSDAALRVVIAPDKFKGSLTAIEAAEAMQRGVLDACATADCALCPMADGGEGTVDAFVAFGAQRRSARVHGPLGEPVDAAYALSGDRAIVEMSAASGLGLLQRSQYDPLRADTFGTGELLLAAAASGVKSIIVGLGGSATNDAGTGMLRALGVRFLDASGEEIGAGDVLAFARLRGIDLRGLDEHFRALSLDVAVDVDNPLCGPRGASFVFGAQKGATAEQQAELDRTLAHIADVAARTLERDVRDDPGTGAAGGLGFAFHAFLGALLEPGVRIVARVRGLDDALKGAGLCLTGEGKIDESTLRGKTVWGVAQLAAAHGVPVVAFGGRVEPDAASALQARGVEVVAVTPVGTPPEDAMREAARYVEGAARMVAAPRCGSGIG